MGLKELLAKSSAAAPKKVERGPKEDRLRWIDMSRKGYDTTRDGEKVHVPGNRGTIKFLPIQDVTGRDVLYPYDVWEYTYESQDEEKPDQYYYTNCRYGDPKDYSELSDDEKALILKARAKIQFLSDNYDMWPRIQNKNYAIIFGYVLEHISNDNNETILSKDNRHAALIMFPSKNFAKGMTNCLNSMAKMGDQLADEMYNDLFSRNKERSVYLEVSFDLGSGFGYDCTVSAKPIDRFAMNMLSADELKDQKVIIPDDQLNFCQSLSATFFAGGHLENNKDFDADLCQKVIDQCDVIINQQEKLKHAEENLPPLPNKNKKVKSDLDDTAKAESK